MELAPAPGVLQGLRYPLAPDLEGLHHLFTSFLTIEIRDAPWPERARWLEVLGADVLVAPEPLEAPPLVLSAINKAYGGRSFFFRIVDPAPEAFWPDTLVVASSPLDAFERVARSRGSCRNRSSTSPADECRWWRRRLTTSSSRSRAREVWR
jgi:hypothetical protein